MYRRYFTIDPDAGTLTRYKNESEAPMNPIEVISI